jgi:hypothetical protein
MHRFTRDGPLSKEDLIQIRQRLARMAMGELRQWYQSAYDLCRLEEGRTPKAAFIQQLVQAWKELRRRAGQNRYKL